MELSSFNTNVFGTINYQFRGYRDENVKIVSHQYKSLVRLQVCAGMCRLTWLCVDGKVLSFLVFACYGFIGEFNIKL
jgi:hypothetical protein